MDGDTTCFALGSCAAEWAAADRAGLARVREVIRPQFVGSGESERLCAWRGMCGVPRGRSSAPELHLPIDASGDQSRLGAVVVREAPDGVVVCLECLQHLA